ncbi:MAG: cytochrome c-type biogenesis protein CcmH [Candidatus Poribacteria bacterium]|nr:cytochrome c-type biogenesis protein CcmH [Candidatus Poribacteria bacterium]MDE0502633.1 cytochrome c-type biogenesis protein CcmH [Candidatus Poribacteria bacterium]
MTSLKLLCIALATGLCLVAISRAVSANETDGNTESSIDTRLEELKTSVYCYCGCTRETIQQCVCTTARQIENDFRESLLSGISVEQIRDEYIAKYGTQFFALMPPTGFNLVAYAMPVIIIVLIGAIISLVIRSKMRSSSSTQHETHKTGTVLSADVQNQIEAELDNRKGAR